MKMRRCERCPYFRTVFDLLPDVASGEIGSELVAELKQEILAAMKSLYVTGCSWGDWGVHVNRVFDLTRALRRAGVLSRVRSRDINIAFGYMKGSRSECPMV